MKKNEIDKKIKLIEKRIFFFKKAFEKCQLCPRKCSVNRLKGEKGFCGAGNKAKVHSYNLHEGEEPPLSGTRGSGTIFFSHYTMNCSYCQNWQFSQKGEGSELTSLDLSRIMLELNQRGAHNINLVSPTHFLPVIVEALYSAYSNGLHIPVVFNSSGYDSPEVIRNLDGIIDIYLADMRYSQNKFAIKYSNARVM